MKIRRKSDGKPGFTFPLPTYFLAKLVHSNPQIGDALHGLESRYLNSKLNKTRIEKPIYVVGLARAGTTITTQMLGEHNKIATHTYLNMPMPYLPYWFRRLVSNTSIMTKPTERLHKDGLMVTRDSSEAVEEIFWQRYFQETLEENESSIINHNGDNTKFERFYMSHIKKLLLSHGASRYACKNNYNVARMKYIQSLFSDAKFVILVRNPFSHIASLVKQDMVLERLKHENPFLQDWTKIIGHRDLGSWKICINLDDGDTVKSIRKLWSENGTYVKGWALYWSYIYRHIHNRLQNDEKLNRNSLVVNYEALCKSPKHMIDGIFKHIEINDRDFRRVREDYAELLHEPGYYSVEFSHGEKKDIIEATSSTAKEFGYDIVG
ncbi:MAG: sulfotransferase [Candidatus Thorarchaeota archaeon]|nr:sulfotransferase [Candidatus Thorarchaeota archaeon]